MHRIVEYEAQRRLPLTYGLARTAPVYNAFNMLTGQLWVANNVLLDWSDNGKIGRAHV